MLCAMSVPNCWTAYLQSGTLHEFHLHADLESAQEKANHHQHHQYKLIDLQAHVTALHSVDYSSRFTEDSQSAAGALSLQAN
jgi:hypothetical protein